MPAEQRANEVVMIVDDNNNSEKLINYRFLFLRPLSPAHNKFLASLLPADARSRAEIKIMEQELNMYLTRWGALGGEGRTHWAKSTVHFTVIPIQNHFNGNWQHSI